MKAKPEPKRPKVDHSLKGIRERALDMGESPHAFRLRQQKERLELAEMTAKAEEAERSNAWLKLNRHIAETANGDREGISREEWAEYDKARMQRNG